MTRARAQRGASLIELVTSIVIIAIATFGLMLAISAVGGRSADPMIERQALAIAEAYLEEAAQAAFCDPDFISPGSACRNQCTASACASGCGGSGAFAEASRALYDDVCDYDDGGTPDVGARDRNGLALPGLTAYTVGVRVVDSGFTLGTPPLSADAGQVVRIDVSVAHDGLAHDIVLSAYRANVR